MNITITMNTSLDGFKGKDVRGDRHDYEIRSALSNAAIWLTRIPLSHGDNGPLRDSFGRDVGHITVEDDCNCDGGPQGEGLVSVPRGAACPHSRGFK